MGEEISKKASLAMDTLKEENRAYEKRLKFFIIEEKLIAPDIDIIIYKANRFKERIGFVCVEIGNDQNTYVYQQIDQVTLQGICDKLKAYDVEKKQAGFFTKICKIPHKAVTGFINHISPYYLVLSMAEFIYSNVGEGGFLASGAWGVLSTIVEIVLTFALMARIMDSILPYKNAITAYSQNESVLAEFISSEEIQSAVKKLEEARIEAILYQKDLGRADKILQIDENCSTIWLLSDLSHDIANENFYSWLSRELKSYSDIMCRIIYTTGVATVGRLNRINQLKNMYSDRVKTHELTNIAAHYIWSETHGIVFIENTGKQHDIYISLGSSNGTFYKKVITEEEESATLLGVLTTIANIEL